MKMLSCTRLATLLLLLRAVVAAKDLRHGTAQPNTQKSTPYAAGAEDELVDNCTATQQAICTCSTGVSIKIENVERLGVRKGGASLCIVLDCTESMTPEVSAIRNTIREVVAAGKGSVDKFVLVAVKDPYEQKLKSTTSAEELHEFLANLKPSKGSDRPEPLIHGIRDAATLCSNNSIIFLFSDSTPKSDEPEAETTQLLVEKNIMLHAVSTGAQFPGKNATLGRMTAATKGKLLVVEPTANRTVMTEAVMKYMEKFLEFGLRFLRPMPKTMDNLKSISTGDCSSCNATELVPCDPQPPTRKTQTEDSSIIWIILAAVLGGLLLLALLAAVWITVSHCCRSEKVEETPQ